MVAALYLVYIRTSFVVLLGLSYAKEGFPRPIIRCPIVTIADERPMEAISHFIRPSLTVLFQHKAQVLYLPIIRPVTTDERPKVVKGQV